eukprot:COSAG05_NODE_2901_length_2526_cov_2.026370_2_plen_79_part_00
MQIHTYHKVKARQKYQLCRVLLNTALQGWFAEHIDSSKFVDQAGHENPPTMAIKRCSVLHRDATVDTELPRTAYTHLM